MSRKRQFGDINIIDQQPHNKRQRLTESICHHGGTSRTLCKSKYCSVCFNKSFASNPKSSSWSGKNNKNPRYLFKSSHSKYWFDCDKCNHSFNAGLDKVTGGRWCPFCGGHKLCDKQDCIQCLNKSFASHPKSLYWSDKNKKNSRDVFKSSNKKYWFDCDKCNHSFNPTLSDIAAGTWCPYCSNSRLCDNGDCMKCFNKSFASYPKSSCWSKKNKKKPRNVFKSAQNKYWFDCDKCNHSFNAKLNHISADAWCPYCSSNKLCDNSDCMECLSKSFASYPKSSCWSTKNKKEPRNVFKSTRKKFWFDCDKCSHSFNVALYSVASGSWCPFCAHIKLCNNNDCTECFNKSFASNPKSSYWSTKNKKKPRDVFKSSNLKYWFDCDKCNHSFDSVLNSISAGSWCPYCGNYKICDKQDCMQCFNKSFASHPASSCWSKKNKKKPRDVCKSTADKYWFDCDGCNHSFKRRLNDIISGVRCLKCRPAWSHVACDWLDYVAKTNNIKITHGRNSDAEYKIPGSKYYADGYCEERNTVYEFQGCFWHGCPKCYDPNKINNVTNKTMQELFDKTKRKEEFIRNRTDLNLVVMWECEWKSVQCQL